MTDYSTFVADLPPVDTPARSMEVVESLPLLTMILQASPCYQDSNEGAQDYPLMLPMVLEDYYMNAASSTQLTSAYPLLHPEIPQTPAAAHIQASLAPQ
jgi:hypothetical protein